MASSTIAIIILVLTMALFASGKLPIALTAVCSALAMAICGVIPFARAFSGFANDATLMVMGSIIIGEALFETGMAKKIGVTIIRLVGTNERLFVVVCVILSAILSAFLSNTAVVAMLMPVVAATAASSRGKITKKNTFMAIGFAANVGGGMTLVGSTPNVIAQGVLQDAGQAGMGFFDLFWGSIPRLLFIIVFYATVGYSLQKKVFTFEEVAEGESAGEEKAEETYYRSKMIISAAILVFAVVGFVSGIWTVGGVAMVAGVLCILTGCIDLKTLFRRMDWDTVWILAGALGLAAGVADSGAGELIANTVISFMGGAGSISMFKLLVIFTILGVLLANVMSSTASMAMLGPIILSMCTTLNFPAKPVMMVAIWALNLAFLTPVATVPVTMTLRGGYRFTDYTKIGVIVMIGCLILSVATYPVIFMAYM